MPQISVIMPVYNKERYVEAALRSVMNQIFRDMEILVVNDGSTDGSLAIVKRLAEADPRIRVFDIPNGGVSNARNYALEHIAGHWIQFLDADDFLEPDYLSRAMDLLVRTPVDILFSAFTMVNEKNELVREIVLGEEGIVNQKQLCDLFIQNQYKNGFFGFISNKLFSRELLTRAGARFPVGITLAEDLDFYSQLYSAVERARFWSGKSFLYLQTESNYVYNGDINYYDQLRVHMDIAGWFKKVGMYEKYRAELDKRISQYVGYVFLYDNETRKDIAKAYAYMISRPDIMAHVDPLSETGFNRNVLRCLCSKNLMGIRLLFAVRNRIRAVYRMVKRA